MNVSHAGTMHARRIGLYKVGGIAALMAGAFYFIEIIGVIALGPPPTTVIGRFTLLQHKENPFSSPPVVFKQVEI